MKSQDARPEPVTDHAAIQQLLDDYLRMYATRDERLIAQFSVDFSGYTGGGAKLVKDQAEWIAITRQDFAQIQEPIRIEEVDRDIQVLAETVAVATCFFRIHLPIKDHILSRETARLVLIFRRESAGWKICHSGISIPYHLVREGEVYPLLELVERNRSLEEQVTERTRQLAAANQSLQRANDDLAAKIVEHQQAEAALQKSEERYRSILNASPDDITITDPYGRVVMVSPQAVTLFRCEPAEKFIGLLVTDFIVPEDRGRALAQVALKRQGMVTGPAEYMGLRPDGSTFPIEVNSEFMRDAAGTPTGMVVIVRDITERKEAERERERLAAQDRQLAKAESLGRMARAIAHHFNNQLHAVMMNLEMARGDLASAGGPVEGVTRAMASARKAADVSRLMLTYLGKTGNKHEAWDLAEVCRQSLAPLRAGLPPGVDLQADLPSPGPIIEADAAQIQQVLANLVANAGEASVVPGGVVRVSVSSLAAAAIPPAHRFPIDAEPGEAAYACLEVADAGSGISAEDQEKIFDPFFTSKFPGRGMGLAVALGITRAHDGIITVESATGRGSVFRVFLPCRAGAPARGGLISPPAGS